MDKPQFTKDISELFDKDCNYNGYSSRNFTEGEKATFLDHLWEKCGDGGHIDYSSPQAIAAMFRARRLSESVQVQLEHFPVFFAQEVEKAKEKKK